ncbi:MAG TPA: hypothetical protein VL294_07365 [Pseudolysinimonas sp.]|jgi:hypothetical protein|nr:hypothetical protein [Pseudolysinimonas sp.]
MGFFGDLLNSANQALGGADAEVIQNGIIGRGEVLGVDASGMTLQIGNGLVERKCTLTLNVMIDGQQPWQAQVTQRIQEVYIPQLTAGGAVVAVRVDPNDHNRIAIDFDTPVPEVTLPASEGTNSAAWILEHGKPITVVLVANSPIGVKNAKGDPVQALTLTVATGVPEPYQIQVGNAVPASALPLVFPGSKLHAKLGDGPNDVVVDWAAGAVKE